MRVARIRPGRPAPSARAESAGDAASAIPMRAGLPVYVGGGGGDRLRMSSFLSPLGPRAVLRLGVIALSALLLLNVLDRPAGPADHRPHIDPALPQALGQGRVGVIVELRLPGGWRPEGELSDPAAVAAQRNAIADVQAMVVTRLAGTTASTVRRYASTPWLALEIDADGLRRLESMGDLVSRVVLPRQYRPQPHSRSSSSRGSSRLESARDPAV